MIVGLSLIPIVGVSALVADGGLQMMENLHAQAVADSGALAAANKLYSNYSTDAGLDVHGYAASAAQRNAAANGYENASDDATVTVNIPPLSGNFIGKAGYVEVIVQKNRPRLFSALWGSGTMTVTARAVARGMTKAYSKAALLVLDPTGTSVNLSGSTHVTAANGNIVVDSTSSSSILSSGAPSITTPELDLSGNIQYSGNNPNHATTTKFGQPNTPDPLASLPVPSSTGMSVGSSTAISLSGAQTRTLNPGIYNGLTMSGSSSVTLNPGMYYFRAGGISTSGASSIIGTNVFIYNTGGGTINLSGTGGVSLSPMTSGTYAGLTIFQDRTNTAGATLSGGTSISNTGTFYFAGARVTLSGSSGVAVMGAQFIAKDLTFSGSAGVTVNYDNSVARSSGISIVE